MAVPVSSMQLVNLGFFSAKTDIDDLSIEDLSMINALRKVDSSIGRDFDKLNGKGTVKFAKNLKKKTEARINSLKEDLKG